MHGDMRASGHEVEAAAKKTTRYDDLGYSGADVCRWRRTIEVLRRPPTSVGVSELHHQRSCHICEPALKVRSGDL